MKNLFVLAAALGLSQLASAGSLTCEMANTRYSVTLGDDRHMATVEMASFRPGEPGQTTNLVCNDHGNGNPAFVPAVTCRADMQQDTGLSAYFYRTANQEFQVTLEEMTYSGHKTVASLPCTWRP